jgi:ribonuclease HII
LSKRLASLRLDFTRPGAIVAGVDEAGRGPLAGPVVAAAVVLDDRRPIDGLKDSKALSAGQRAVLARRIRRSARAFALGFATPAEVDAHNILRASLLAMERAVLGLALLPDLIRVDGRDVPRFARNPQAYLAEPVIRGDATVPCISAASILAKVCRDRLMRRLHRRYPGYGFDRNKGYPTPAHLAALEAFGPCEIHRASFAPVRRKLAEALA